MVLFVLGFLLQLCTATGSRPTQSLRANTSSLFKQNPGSQTEILKLTGHIFKESIPLLSSRDDIFRHSRMSSEYQHDVVFVIKQKNMDELTTFLHDVSDPSSINYGRHMTRKAVAEMTANSEARDAVLTYLRQNGASIISETLSSEYITSRAPVGVWERVFNCKFFLFHFSQADGEVTKVVRTESYSIPTALEHHVESVFNTVQMPHQPMNGFMTKVEGTESTDGKEHLQSTDKYITPALLRTAYNIGTKQGSTLSSQCVYATGNQNFSPTDLVKFQSFFQLPAQPVATITGGHASSAVCDATPDLCGEANLDVQYLMAMSPVSPTTFWYSEYNGFSGWLVTIANLEKPPLVFSISYGIDEKLVPASEFTAFNTQAIKLGAIGVSIVAASGDDGAISRKVRLTPSACFYAPNFPASNPYVTAVGATSGVESGTKEVACQANNGGSITTGGGFSSVYPQLPFQAKAIAAYYTAAAKAGKSPVAGYTATGRGFPDVSLAGLNYKVYIGGQLYSVSGTSASAPVMAGLLSNLNSVRLAAGKPAMGWANPALYTNSSLFINDITSGDNKCAGTGMKSTVNCCPQGFTTTTGWDPVTGLGAVDYGKMESTFIKLGYFSSLASAVSSAQRISYERASFIALGAMVTVTSLITFL